MKLSNKLLRILQHQDRYCRNIELYANCNARAKILATALRYTDDGRNERPDVIILSRQTGWKHCFRHRHADRQWAARSDWQEERQGERERERRRQSDTPADARRLRTNLNTQHALETSFTMTLNSGVVGYHRKLHFSQLQQTVANVRQRRLWDAQFNLPLNSPQTGDIQPQILRTKFSRKNIFRGAKIYGKAIAPDPPSTTPLTLNDLDQAMITAGITLHYIRWH